MRTHESCPDCGHHDCLTIFDEGNSYCNSCGKSTVADNVEAQPQPERRVNNQPMLSDLDYTPLPARSISLDACKKYGYGVTFAGGEPVQVAPYHDKAGRVVGQKVRPKDKNRMRFRGENPGTLFGQHLFRPNPKLRLTITEGELDCLSVWDAQGDYPCVSLSSGAQSARKNVAENLDWVSGFKEVVLAFDMDEPGREAAEAVAQILPVGKAFIAQLPLKDANEMMVAGRRTELREALWRATPYRPDGVTSASDMWDEVSSEVEPAFATYPWPFFNEYLGGLRHGELVCFTAGSGVGKSTVTREITYSLTQVGHKVGVLALEESVKQTVLYQMGLHLNQHVHMGHQHIDPDLFRQAFDAVTPNLVCWDHFGSAETDRIESIIRHMALAEGCQTIVLDHVSMCVSGLQTTNERRDLDVLMTKLRSIAEQLNLCIIAVSHIKRLPEDRREIRLTDLRGSASIEQLSDAVVSLERGDKATTVRVLKNRQMGWKMGVAGRLRFDDLTGRLVEAKEEETEDGSSDF